MNTYTHMNHTNKYTCTCTCTCTDTALDRLTDPGDEFKGQHRSKVSSHGNNSSLKLLDSDALDVTATKLQVIITFNHFSSPSTHVSVP